MKKLAGRAAGLILLVVALVVPATASGETLFSQHSIPVAWPYSPG
jgi:hypothetical protein